MSVIYTHRTVKGHSPARILCTDLVVEEHDTHTTLVAILNDDEGPNTEEIFRYPADLTGGYRGALEPIPERVEHWLPMCGGALWGDYNSHDEALAATTHRGEVTATVKIISEGGVPVSMEVFKT